MSWHPIEQRAGARRGRQRRARAAIRQHRLGAGRREVGQAQRRPRLRERFGRRGGRDIIAGTGREGRAVHFDQPDGININVECGAVSPEALARDRARSGADIGFALDGDADRCVAVDEHGEVVDGDRLIGIIALDRSTRRAGRQHRRSQRPVERRPGEGRHAAGGRVVRTPSATSTSSTACSSSGAGLGGEKSGHVIIREHTTAATGSSPRSRCWTSLAHR